MTQYTSVGAQLDLAVTTAVDISVEKDEKETERTPNALRWDGHEYARIDLSGHIKLTNHTDRPAELEITRYVLGTVGQVDQGGKGEMVNVVEDPGFVPAGTPGGTSWWGWYKWPDWWHRVNGIGRITWKQKLDPAKSILLNYDWYYHWW
jgi:hypothetical protein